MNIAIDIGNSLAKVAIIEDGQVVDFLKAENIDNAFIEQIFSNYPEIEAGIIVSARDNDEELMNLLQKRLRRFINFDASVPVPLTNKYATPQTLGCDRLAAAVGANAVYPENNILIFNFGTALTIDFVSKQGEFLGGNISPGASIRFKALHHFTKKLPLRTLPETAGLIGNSSASAIENGVVNGIVYEIEGYIRDFEKKYDDLRIIFTGGDGDFFAKKLKNPIFATYDLVAYGLNRILEYNAQKK